MLYHIKHILLVLFISFSCSVTLTSQVSFELKTSPDVDFTFISVGDYVGGITRFNALKLNVSSDRRWDLWVKSTSANWSVIDAYSLNGTIPDISLLELRVRNASSTPLLSGFFAITDVEQYLIGTTLTDLDVACPGAGANVAGSYLTTPSCYEFFVDFRIKPGIDPINYLKPGLYRLEVLFTIIEDL